MLITRNSDLGPWIEHKYENMKENWEKFTCGKTRRRGVEEGEEEEGEGEEEEGEEEEEEKE